jgi:hypothetical protein
MIVRAQYVCTASSTQHLMSLRETTDLLAAQSYPLTAQELAANCGGHKLDLPNGSEPLHAVIERSGAQRFENVLEAQLAVYGAVGAEAVGRVGYSDRDPAPMGTDGPRPVSF